MLTLRTEVCYQERPQEPHKTGRNLLVLFQLHLTDVMNFFEFSALGTDYNFTSD